MNTNSKIGKLLLVETKQKPNKGNQLVYQKQPSGKIDIFLTVEPIESYLDNVLILQPIIICDDEIKVGDKFLSSTGVILEYDGRSYAEMISRRIVESDKKILVQPNQFSPEFLQAIIDGKIKDKVEVEIENKGKFEYAGCRDSQEKVWRDNIQLKLRKDDTAIIRKYEETVEEAAHNYIVKSFEKVTPKQYEELTDAFKAAIEWHKNQKK